MEKRLHFLRLKGAAQSKIKHGQYRKPTVESKTTADRTPASNIEQVHAPDVWKSAIKAKEPSSLQLTPA
ncbi:hypothetical protein PO124_01555 [Bacillus licheniformis]|nr:hypothetical protein [Bacillus licheniformis]